MKASKQLMGRDRERTQLEKALRRGHNVLIEGAVGVGKTHLVKCVLQDLKKDFERVDGDSRYTEQKLTGWFDPPLVLKRGYTEAAFIAGPLLEAMQKGKILFINELNRMPEAVQNILLPAMDERQIMVPKIGEVKAKAGFVVVATQNPREFTATHALSEALLDRFDMITLGYLPLDIETEIVSRAFDLETGEIKRIVELVRATRDHASIKRGASVRAALAIADLVHGGISLEDASLMALPTRIELISMEEDPKALIEALLAGRAPTTQKKKS